MFSLYWIVTLIFLMLDFSGLCRRFKVQPGTNEPPETWRLTEASLLVLFNQIVTSVIFSGGGFWISHLVMGQQDLREVPSFAWLMTSLLMFYFIFDVIFYSSHRLMHTPFFYKHVHKVHHQWKAPIGFVAINAHPLGP